MRELQIEQERARHAEEMLREVQTRRQMKVLQALVEGVQIQGEAANSRAERDKDVCVPNLTDEDDIVTYLTMFEQLMEAYEVRKEHWVHWAFELVSFLVSKARSAYAAMSTASYEKFKEAILQRYDITADRDLILR